jgi:hypothetical protein
MYGHCRCRTNLDSEQEAKEQLVLLKQAPADVAVQQLCEALIQASQPLFKWNSSCTNSYCCCCCFRGLSDSHLKQIDEPLQRVLLWLLLVAVAVAEAVIAVAVTIASEGSLFSCVHVW